MASGAARSDEGAGAPVVHEGHAHLHWLRELRSARLALEELRERDVAGGNVTTAPPTSTASPSGSTACVTAPAAGGLLDDEEELQEQSRAVSAAVATEGAKPMAGP